MPKKSDENTAIPKKIDRGNLLEISSSLVESLYIRLNVERFKEREGDPIRLQYVRALIQALQAHNAILKDIELEDINRRLDDLEALKHDT